MTNPKPTNQEIQKLDRAIEQFIDNLESYCNTPS